MIPARQGLRSGALEIPGSDVGIVAGSARLAVGAEREHVDLAAQSRVQILVRAAPGVVAQLVEVAPGFQFGGIGSVSGRATRAASPCSAVG